MGTLRLVGKDGPSAVTLFNVYGAPINVGSTLLVCVCVSLGLRAKLVWWSVTWILPLHRGNYILVHVCTGNVVSIVTYTLG